MLIDHILTILPYFATICFLFSLLGYSAENKRLKRKIELLERQK
ncbi:hypothetical protein HB162lentus_04090 [Mammaliicoccus lentus]|nr:MULTISPECIES: hypothetical protein [Mammaliicoccus]WQK49145.1 hypothetical protein P3U54_08995 [Mammaliicoccus lentus]